MANGAEVDSSTNYGVTTLMMAARSCPTLVPKVVDNIKKIGQDLKDSANKRDYAGHAAVHYAVGPNTEVSKRTLAKLKAAQACMQVNSDNDECALMCYTTNALDEGCTVCQIWNTVQALVSDVYPNNEWVFFDAWLATTETCEHQKRTYVDPWKLSLSREQRHEGRRHSILGTEVHEPKRMPSFAT